MKKIVLFISISLLTNLVIAAKGEWPIFSNKKGAEYTLYMLKGIINKFPETSQIDNYAYKIDPHTCELPLNPDDFNETQLVEYKIAEASESDAHDNTTNYALFIADSKIDDSSLVVTRSEINDIAITDDFVSIESHSDIIDDTQKKEILPTTKKKKRVKTKKKEKSIEDKTKKALRAKKIKREKKLDLQKKEGLTSSQLVNPVHISKQNSTSVVPEFSKIEDNEDVTAESDIKCTPVSKTKSVSATNKFTISNKVERTKSKAPTQHPKIKQDNASVKKDNNCSLM
ncbi:MAG: hypothetical protein Q8K37_06945 [Alphaproteobacteria bacterium]|nr:hypothetical protein [Alphaproteobacteria bacterium]